MVTNVNFVIKLKNRLARGTLFAPIQFPTMPQVDSWIPKITMKRVYATAVQIVIEASWATPSTPANSVRTSKAHHFEQIIIVEGSEIFRYSDHPRNESPFIGISVGLI